MAVVDKKRNLLTQRRRRSKPIDARLCLLRAFDSAAAWPAMGEAVLGRVEWRRGELNPRPEITRMAASTCIVDGLISIPAAGIDTLRRGPVVFVSPFDQRPNRKASPLFCSQGVTGAALC